MTTILSTVRATREAQCAMSGVHASFTVLPFAAVSPVPAFVSWDESGTTTSVRSATARITPPLAALSYNVRDGAGFGAVKDDPGLRSCRPPV